AWAELNNRLDQAGTWEGELRQTRRDGTPVIVQSREVLVRDEHGARSAVLSIKRDVTQRKQAMETLKEADRRKDEFLATLAHELRNPIAPIRNAVEIMRLAGDDPAVLAQARDVLYRQVRQVSGIVEDLIDLSRIVEKKVQLRMEHIALAPVVQTALESCRSAIEARHHRLHVAMPQMPVFLHADPVRLGQILINLLSNAPKFTQAAGQIWFSGEVRNEPPTWRLTESQPEFARSGHLVLRVLDTGIGIDPSFLPHVFEMFSQADRTLEDTRGGLGVGLTLTRALVQMHGGDI